MNCFFASRVFSWLFFALFAHVIGVLFCHSLRKGWQKISKWS